MTFRERFDAEPNPHANLTRAPGDTFVQTAKADPRDRIDVEVGDSKQPDFHPQVKIMRWGNEVNFSLRAEEHPAGRLEAAGPVVKYLAPGYEIHLFDKPDAGEDGGFEFAWVLLAPPVSNVLRGTVRTKGLDFFFQPPLTQEEIDEGAQRPENVVGSYAAYHQSRGGLSRVDGMDYRVGKAFHIYRPEAVDAHGARAWADLHIDAAGGLLTVTIPQAFLDGATYPILVDPTFGYTSIGATSTTGAIGLCKFTAAAENGDITSMTAYAETLTGSGSLNHGKAIYSDSAGAPNAKLAEDSGNVTVTEDPAWATNNITYSFAASTVLWLGMWTDSTGGNQWYYYDTGATNQRAAKTGTFETWPDPFSSPTYTARKVSIYATYTAVVSAVPRSTPYPQLLAH